MVVEVSKEIDVVRIGIDRYSLKTGCNFRTIMDLSISVMKEPRGFIRVLQCVMAILAFSTTAGFSTLSTFSISCEKEVVVNYTIEYPFEKSTLQIPDTCEKKEKLLELRLPFDYSTVAEFYVTTGVLSFLYIIGILIVYIFFHQTYAENPKLPMMDFGVTGILTIFWMAGSSAWAQGVTDLKYYLHPNTIFQILFICMRDESLHDCKSKAAGSYGVLNASIVLGFANFMIWLASLWFIYKETELHKSDLSSDSAQNQVPKSIGRPADVRKV